MQAVLVKDAGQFGSSDSVACSRSTRLCWPRAAIGLRSGLDGRPDADPTQPQIRTNLVDVVLEEAIWEAELYRRALHRGAQLRSVHPYALQSRAAFLSAQLDTCVICLEAQSPESAVTSCANGPSCHLACLRDALLFAGLAPCFHGPLSRLHFTSPGECGNLLMSPTTMSRT